MPPPANRMPVRQERGLSDGERLVLSRRFDQKRTIGLKSIEAAEPTNTSSTHSEDSSYVRLRLRRALTLE